jgi:hypothetical protein
MKYFKTSNSWVSFFLILLAFYYSLFSYPMLFPGYDFELHLFYIEKPQHTYNNFWHICWNVIFEFFRIEESTQSRALIIHRTQTFISILLLSLSSYIFFDITFGKLDTHTKIQLSLISVIFWFTMHGTYSSPRGEWRFIAKHTLSWLQWYSVNYQISLPFAIFGSMTFLKLIESQSYRKFIWFVLTGCSAFIVLKFHSAELIYMVFLCFGVLIVYGIPRYSLKFNLLLVLLLVILIYSGIKLSYRQPPFVELLLSGDWSGLNRLRIEFNHFLIEKGQNRNATSWHHIYSLYLIVNIIFLSAHIFLHKGISPLKKSEINGMIFIAYSSIMAFLILFKNSSAAIALVVGPGITWRFGFSTILFLSVPYYIGYYLSMNNRFSLPSLNRQIVMFFLPILIIIIFSLWSYFFENASPYFNFTKAMIYSLDMKKSLFLPPPPP